MKKLTDFLGKPVISLYEGNIEGYVKNVVFEKGMKKIKYFVLFEDNDFQDEKMLESSKIYKYLSDAIIIKNNSVLELKKDEVFNIENHINCKVYESNGKYIGLVADIELNDDLTTNTILLNNNISLSPNDFLTFGQDIFIKQDEENIIKIANIRKRDNVLKQTATNTRVTILPEHKSLQTENTYNQTNATISQTEQVTNDFIQNNTPPSLPVFPEAPTENLNTKHKYVFSDLSIPKKLLLSNSDFLIGRKTTKTIYSTNNEIVVKKNMIINQKILQNAVIYNKLRELAIYSA